MLKEVKNAIQELKTFVSAGNDDIAAELIKMSPKKLTTWLHRLILRIWETVQLPEEWKKRVFDLFTREVTVWNVRTSERPSTKCYPRSSSAVFHLKHMNSWLVIKPASMTDGRQSSMVVPEGGQSQKDTVDRAFCKNSRQQPCKVWAAKR